MDWNYVESILINRRLHYVSIWLTATSQADAKFEKNRVH